MFSLDVEVTEAIGLRLCLVPWFKGNVTLPEAIRHVPECGGECDERALCEVTPHARDTKHWAGRVSSRKHVVLAGQWSIASPSRKCRTERMAMGAWPTGVSRDVVNMWLALLDVFGSHVHVIRVCKSKLCKYLELKAQSLAATMAKLSPSVHRSPYQRHLPAPQQ